MAYEFMTVDEEMLVDKRKTNIETTPPVSEKNDGQINSRVS